MHPDGADSVIEGLARRQRIHELFVALRSITHGALLAPIGEAARAALVSWGFPEPSLDRLDIADFPDPAFIGWELARRGAPAAEAEDAGLLQPSWSGHVVGPWRNPRGRILTFFVWEPEGANGLDRYAYAPRQRPRTLFGQPRAMSLAINHLWMVEGLLDVLLASCSGMEDGVAVGGPVWLLSVQRLEHLAASGTRELTLIPSDDEAGRLGVLTALENANRMQCSALEVFVVDPALMAGAHNLGELVRRRGSRAFAELGAGRMEGNIYRLVMVPW